MKKLVSFKELSHSEWLRCRKAGITGSDAGAIVGLNPYKSSYAVYQDKLSEETGSFDNEAMRQGRDLEEYVARRFTEETGLKVRRANAIYYNEEHPIMLADFDRLIVSKRAGLECKTVSPYSSDQWEDGKIPLHYQMQVQHYLAVSGFDCWYIAALIFGTRFVVHKIERDEELIRDLITIEENFWNHHVLPRVIPEPDGSDDYSKMLSKAYFKTNKETEVSLFGLEGDLKRREEIKEVIEKLEKEKKSIEQKIQLQLGTADASYGVAGNYRISWVTAISNRLDSKKLKEEKPELYQEYSKEIISKRFIVKKQKEIQKVA